MKTMKTKDEVIKYLNSPKFDGYDGFVQFSHREFDEKTDLFCERKISVKNEVGFISEAYFSKAKGTSDGRENFSSISIRMLDGEWFVSEMDLSVDKKDILVFSSRTSGFEIKMAQIWQEEGGFAKDLDGKILDEFTMLCPKGTAFVGFEKEIS